MHVDYTELSALDSKELKRRRLNEMVLKGEDGARRAWQEMQKIANEVQLAV
jgi:hypothetical protein